MGFIRVTYGVVRHLYESVTNQRRDMAVTLRTTRVKNAGNTDNHDAITVRYNASTVKMVAPRAHTIVCSLMVIVIMILLDSP